MAAEFDAVERQFEDALVKKLHGMTAEVLTAEALVALSVGDLSAFFAIVDAVSPTRDAAEIAAILGSVARETGLPTMQVIVDRARARVAAAAAPELAIGAGPAFTGTGLSMPPHGVVQMGFDIVSENVVKWAEGRSTMLVVQIREEMRDTIRTHVTTALRGGMTTQETARTLARVIPLHSRFANAVTRRHARLLSQGIADGMSLARAVERADRMSATYARRLTRLRARTIARTEVMTASNYGQLQSYRTAIESGLISNPALGQLMVTREWITAADERVCEVCGPLDKKQVDWSEPFPGGLVVPPAHPNCRCSFNVIDHADQFDWDGAGTAEQEFAGELA